MSFGKEEEVKREERRRAKIAAEVTEDFERRREERRQTESGWLLNMNFFSGNQYCDVSPYGGIVEEDKRFYWQSRRVFNHIAPTIDSRIAKLTKMRPALKVRPFSDEEADVKTARLASGILEYVRERIRLDETAARGTLWSETCGSAFYKIVWDETGGRQVAVDERGAPVYEGEVCVSVVPPFEIFPDRMGAECLGEVNSLIHAQAVPVSYIAERFGVEVAGREITETDFSAYSEPSNGKKSRASDGRQPRSDKGLGNPHRTVFAADGGRTRRQAGDRRGGKTALSRPPALSQRRTRRKKVPFRQTGLFKASRRLFRKQRRRSAGSRSAGV